MLVPLSWLKEYVDIDVSADEFAERMIMSGSNIETVRNYADGVKGLVIGRVVSAVPHENADHLNVCMVDVGPAAQDGKPLQIVCGADNVRNPGILVAVSLAGAALPGGFKIKKTMLRGVESNGMICSAQELGFAEKSVPVKYRDGIWILPDDLKVGSDAVQAIGLDETVVDFEITPNRPDCLSIIGIAREAAAVFGKRLRYPDVSAGAGAGGSGGSGGCAADFVKVAINKPELCPRYVARVCGDIEIKDSPFDMQLRLMFAGMRPINNIVDITNYVMLEYGHPIHAFDIRTIAGEEIVVDTAADGSVFTTLDGKDRELSYDMLLINDMEKPVAIAGVMGGLNSEVVADTNTIVVEAANFNADNIRLTSKKLGLRSEASARFEKGVSAELSSDAADRVCSLVAETASGTVISGSVDNYPGKSERASVDVRTGRVNSLLGTDIPADVMADMFRRLEMKVETLPGDVLRVTPPHVRLDLNEEVDFSEEVARLYGYDELGITRHKDSAEAGVTESWALRSLLRGALAGMGYQEIQTYSFVSPKGLDKAGVPAGSEKRSLVKLINPLGEENSVMRTILLPNMLDILAHNYNHGNETARLFEIGNTFSAAAGEGPADERLSLVIGSYGGGDFFSLKGALNAIFAKFGIAGAVWTPDTDSGSWHPGRCARVSGADGLVFGHVGELHPDVLKNYDIDVAVFAAEIDFEALAKAADLSREYSPLRRFPAVTFDISLLADEDVMVSDVEAACLKRGGGILESVKLFDVYRGEQIAEGKKSLSFKLVYRAKDRTLTDEDAGKVHNAILLEISKATGAALREV